MRASLPVSHPDAIAEIKRLLAAQVDIDTMRSILRDTAGEIGPLLTEDARGILARMLIRLGLEAVLRTFRTFRSRRSLRPAWYGHRDRDLPNNEYDVLADLNRWVDDDQTLQINELLWEAFLADLNDNFWNSRHKAEMTLNCVVLLDDTDTPLGQAFVNGLVHARRNRLALGSDPSDPLTAVVTSRGELLSSMPRHELVEFTGSESDRKLTYDSHGKPYWWCRYKLADLNQHETGVLVSSIPSNIDDNGPVIAKHQLTSMMYGFAVGHPASTAKLVAATRERPLEHGDTLTVLLQRKEPGRDPHRPLLADSLRQQLVGEFTEDTYEDLITCSAASTKKHARLLAVKGELLASGIGGYQEIAPVLWPVSGGAGPVVLRRLLLRQLAARTGDDAPDWTKVFGWLQARCAQDGDEEGRLHYALANGDIATASDGLRRRLATDDPAAWVALLRSVASAPRRPAGADMPPLDQLRATVDKRSQKLTRLVVARSIAFDPFISDRRRALHRLIALDYEFVAGLSAVQGDPEPLLTEADYHRKQAELWS